MSMIKGVRDVFGGDGAHMDYILFGGTTEGRLIAEALVSSGFSALVVVATEYGETALEGFQAFEAGVSNIAVLAQRLDEEEMTVLFGWLKPAAVIDATHPYASLVSGNIGRASEKSGIRCIRVLRGSTIQDGAATDLRVCSFADIDAMVAWLNQCDDVIFSTLGAKDLHSLAEVRGFDKRVFVRILPTVEGIAECRRLGFPMKHIYALHGPFSEDFNAAQFRETGAGIVLTKDTGAAGGFDEKARAAAGLGIKLAVLMRPVEVSASVEVEEILKKLKNKERL